MQRQHPAPPLGTQLPGDAPGKAADDGPSPWALVTRVEDLGEAPAAAA